jgi:hypothetical protein
MKAKHLFTKLNVNHQSALESVDLQLEECIKELQAANTDGTLNHCELADQELDPLLGNATG